MNQPEQVSSAEIYQNYFVPAMFFPWAEVLLRHASPKPRERVLDLACGTGVVARQVAPIVGFSGKVTALDVNPKMLAVAQSIPAPSGTAIHWQEGNAMALPFADGVYDLVVCQHGMQFVPDRLCAAREMHRVLGTNGRACTIVLQALERHPVFQLLMESTARHLSLPLSDIDIPFNLFDADELRALFAESGFGSVDIHAESITVHFPEPERFAPLAVISSAAAVPAFAALEAPAKAAILESIVKEIAPLISKYRNVDHVTFPMYAHVAVAVK